MAGGPGASPEHLSHRPQDPSSPASRLASSDRRHRHHHRDRVVSVRIFRLSDCISPDLALPTGNVIPGLFGTAVATMGMLMTVAFILAMDTFGPITDNAGGIVEMSGQPESIREITDALDTAGNTTKALTKGYAVGSAALAAFLLFGAYLDKVAREATCHDLPGRSISKAGHLGFIGGSLRPMLVFLFSSLAIRAVGDRLRHHQEGRATVPGESPASFWDVTADDAPVGGYHRSGALRRWWPRLCWRCDPGLVGLILKEHAAAGMLMVGTIAGVLLATILNNSGGAWDNAKKPSRLG